MLLASFVFFFSMAFALESTGFSMKLDAKKFSVNASWDVIEAKNDNEFDKAIANRKAMIQRLLAPNIDPYKGSDSVPVECRSESLPKEKSWDSPRERGLLFSFYSSDAKALGACPVPKERLKTQYLVLGCKKESKVYVIRYFYSSLKAWNLEAVASCK